MAQTEVLRLVIDVDSATGAAKLQQFGKTVEETSTKSSVAMGALKTSTLGLLGALGGLASASAAVSFLKDSFLEFAKTERQWAAVTAQLRAFGDVTGDVANRARGMINALSDQTGILDDDLIPAYNRLLLGTKSAEKSQNLLSIAARFAANGFGEVQSNAEALSLALQSGTVRSLKQFGVETEDAAGNAISLSDGLGQVIATFGRLDPKLDDAQAKVDTLRKKWDDFGDSAGSAINDTINWIDRLLDAQTRFNASHGLQYTPDPSTIAGQQYILKQAAGRSEGPHHADPDAALRQMARDALAAETARKAAIDAATAAVKAAVEAERRRLELLKQSVELYKLIADNNRAAAFAANGPSALVNKVASGDITKLQNGALGQQLAPQGPSLEDRDAEIAFADALTVKYATLKEAVDALTAAKDRLRAAGLQVTDSQEQQIASAETAAQSFEAQARVVGVLTQTQQVLSTVSQAAAIAAGKSSKTQFEVMKAVALASAIVNTARAIVEVLPNYYLAAAVAVAGALQIYKIISTHPGSSSAPSTGGAGGGGGSNRGVGPAAGARTFNESGPVGGSETQDRHNGRKEHHVNVKIEAMDGKSVADVVNSKAFRRAVGRAADQAGRRG